MLARRKTTTYNNDINYVAAKNEDVLKAIMQSNKKHEKTMKMLAK